MRSLHDARQRVAAAEIIAGQPVVARRIHSKISISIRSYPFGKRVRWAGHETKIGERGTRAAIAEKVKRF